MKTMTLPNGLEAVGPLALPDDWYCGCGFRVTSIFAFSKGERLWIRARHVVGAGFCEFPAVKHTDQ